MKKTNRDKFNKTLEEEYSNNIPSDRNLTIQEIHEFLEEANAKILNTIEKVVPKIKEKDSINPYLTDRIQKMQKQKNKILTKIHHHKRKWPLTNTRIITNLKKKLEDIRTDLKKAFNTSINNYWENKIKNIPRKDSSKMFPLLNSIFRKKDTLEIASLKIPSNSPLLDKAEIDTTHYEKDENDNILINKLTDKLNILGAHFAGINNNKMENNSPHLNNIINKETKNFFDKIQNERSNGTTICEFNKENRADNPNKVENYKNYFTNMHDLTKRFRSLNNKKSFGLDKIPNVVLKKIPANFIYNYVIIFNNLLNHSYFPDNWKKAKVVPILKKGKKKNTPQVIDPYV